MEKSETEQEGKEEEEEVENNDEAEEDNGDVQSFVTALENDNDHLVDSVNDLHLGHDDEGKQFCFHDYLVNLLLKGGSRHRITKLSNLEL